MFPQLIEKIIMTLALVAVWRASWMLMDYYFGRNVTTMWISLFLGAIALSYINRMNK